jgi:hypothetical protein
MWSYMRSDMLMTGKSIRAKFREGKFPACNLPALSLQDKQKINKIIRIIKLLLQKSLTNTGDLDLLIIFSACYYGQGVSRAE